MRGRFSVRMGAALLALALGCSSGGSTVAPDPASLPEANAGDYAPDATAPAAAAPSGSAAVSAPPGATAAPSAGGPAAVRATESARASTGSGARATAPATAGAKPSAKATATTAPAKRLWVDTKCRQDPSEIGDGNAVQGQRPPHFIGTTTDCRRLDFGAFTQGRPTLVNFYATWCKPCHNEAKDMQDLYQEWHPENGFTIVAILTDDPKGDPTPFYTEYGWTFPSVWDDGKDLLNAYDRKSAALGTLPISYWIHSDGTVMEVVVGGMDRQGMQQRAERLR